MEPGGSMPHSQGFSNNESRVETTQFLVLTTISLKFILMLSSIYAATSYY